MSICTIGAACAAALLSTVIVAAEQTATQTPTQSPVQSGTPGASQQPPPRPDPTVTAGQVTMTGCVTREVAGQFALSNAVRSAAAAASRPDGDEAPRGSAGSTDRGSTGAATGTSGSTRAGSAAGTDDMTYSLAGDRENELEQYVGQRVEIVGSLGVPATSGGTSGGDTVGAGGSGRSGDTAREPVTRPEGTVTGGDANRGSVATSGHAPRLTIVSFRPAGGDCANR
jgi:hypothetical protein